MPQFVSLLEPKKTCLTTDKRLFLLLAVVSRVGSLESTDGVQTGRGILALGIVLFAGAGLCAYILFNIRARSQMVAYARTGRIPGVHTEDSIK
jgi:hypothetical protein